MDNEVLKPCPFCGEWVKWYDGDTVCHPDNDCLLAGDFIDSAKWNRRTTPTDEEVVSVLEETATLFEEYSRLHLAKLTQEGNEKAGRNMRQALKLRALLSRLSRASDE